MIKIVGLGKKRIGMSREEAQKYHIEQHAPFARRIVGPLGMKKYSGYYPYEALSLDGKVLPELPWDFIVPEWYTDECFEGFEAWRAADPDGVEITKDEARFCDRKTGHVMTCQENVIVSPGEDSTGVHVVFLITKKGGMSHEECVKYHKEKHAAMVASTLGERLKSYTAYYVDQVFNLEEGLVPERLYDVVVLARFDDEFWKGLEAWRKTPGGIKIAEDEERFCDRKRGIALVCQQYTYIP